MIIKHEQLISIFFILIFFISCQVEKKIDDNLIFRYNEHNNISSLDPVFSNALRNIWPVHQIFNGLVQLDDSLKIKPDIAKYWNISDNGLDYNFTLKKNIFFHKSKVFTVDSTRSVNAYDFEYSFSRIIDPKISSPGYWAMNNVESFKATNDSVFTIKLKNPFSAFLEMLTMKYFSVVPLEAVEFYGSKFGKNPIGTGPFKFKRWDENIKLVLRKNNNYHELDNNGEKLPYLEAISITFFPEKKTEFLEFLQGKIDFINSIDPSFKDELLDIYGNLNQKYSESINLISGPYLNTEYIGFFLGKNNLNTKSKKLRQAINYGINKTKMIKYLRNNIGNPAHFGFIPLGLTSDSVEGFKYNMEKSKRLLEEYKQESGNNKIQLELSTDTNYLDIMEYIQRELLELGIELKINIMPPSSLRQAKSNGKLEMFRASWIADYPDSENYLSLFYSNNKAPNGPNYTHFINKEYDLLYLNSFKEKSKFKREKIYKQLDKMIIDEAPIIPLYYDQVMRFSKKNVKGLSSNPINQLNLKQVYKK